MQPGNELNGITLGGVGRSTFFENIQVHNGSDDGIEWFGGTVNGRNLALTGIDDDSFDTDFGFQADLQFVLVVQDASANHGWENDFERIGRCPSASARPHVERHVRLDPDLAGRIGVPAAWRHGRSGLQHRS